MNCLCVGCTPCFALGGIFGSMIVIVEDQEEIRLLLQAYFKSLGEQVQAYASAEDASNDFGQLQRQDISTIISDYTLPGSNGVDFIQQAKVQLKPLLCMLISGHLPDTVPEDIVVMAKPFRPSALYQTMNVHLERLAQA